MDYYLRFIFGYPGIKTGVYMERKKWESKNLVHRYDFIEAEEFRKLIEETAEMIYDDFCQLPEDSFYCASNEDLKPLTEAA